MRWGLVTGDSVLPATLQAVSLEAGQRGQGGTGPGGWTVGAAAQPGLLLRSRMALDAVPGRPRTAGPWHLGVLSLCEEPLSSGIRCQTVVLAPPPQPVGDGFTPRGSRVPGLPCSAFGRIFCDHWVLAWWELQARREQWVRGTQPPRSCWDEDRVHTRSGSPEDKKAGGPGVSGLVPGPGEGGAG